MTDVEFYNTWQGLYTSAFVLSLCPAIYGSQYYWMTPFIVIVVSFLSLYIGLLLLANVLDFKFKKSDYFVISISVMTFFIVFMPDAQQGLFWFNGAMNYTPWFFVDFLNASLCLFIIKNAHCRKYVLLIAANCLLSFLLSGVNHVTSTLNLLILFVICVFYFNKSKFQFIPFLFSALGFAIMYIAPGTGNRQSVLQNQSILNTIKTSIKKFFEFCDCWCTVALILTAVLILLFVAINNKKFNKFAVRLSWFNLLVLFLTEALIFVVLLCVPFYAMGSFGEGRVQNIYFFYFCSSAWISWLFFCLLISKAFIKCNSLIISCISVLLFCLLPILPTSLQNNCKEAFSELRSDVAEQYALEYDYRETIALKSSGQELEVQPIASRPKLLTYTDLSADVSFFANEHFANYYKLLSVKVLS